MTKERSVEASFSTLILSIGSSAAVFMGLGPHPGTGKTEKDLPMARFNIDLLVMLEEKTRKNLSEEEKQFLTQMISDLQLKFVEAEGSKN